MSNNYQDWNDEDDFEFEDYSEEPQRGNDEDLVKKVRRAERAKDKELKAVRAELEELRKFRRETTISQVLQEKGINPRIAKFIPESIEISQDSINGWLSENGDVFGFEVPSPQSTVNPDDVNNLRQIDRTTSGASNPEAVNDLSYLIDNAESEEELMQILMNGQ